jgi:hypothetical protein
MVVLIAMHSRYATDHRQCNPTCQPEKINLYVYKHNDDLDLHFYTHEKYSS